MGCSQCYQITHMFLQLLKLWKSSPYYKSTQGMSNKRKTIVGTTIAVSNITLHFKGQPLPHYLYQIVYRLLVDLAVDHHQMRVQIA